MDKSVFLVSEVLIKKAKKYMEELDQGMHIPSLNNMSGGVLRFTSPKKEEQLETIPEK